MRYRMFLLPIIVGLSFRSYADEQRVYGDYASLEIKDDVKWIDETSIQPEDYIGQIFLVKNDNSTIPFYAPIVVPVVVQEGPTIKKSILIKATKEGSVSFLELFKVSGKKESVYQFQIVDSKKWSVNMRGQEYLKAVSGFRNDPATAGIFDSPEYQGVVMVIGVVSKKIWYKAYRKEGFGATGTYYVKVDGNSYSSSEDYEEAVKFGLLLRPISGFGYTLPKSIVSAQQVNEISEKAIINSAATKSLSQSVRALSGVRESSFQ